MPFFKNCSARMSACAARPIGRFFVNVGYGVSQRFSLLSTVLVATLLTEALLKRELSPSVLNVSIGLFIAIPLTAVFIILEVVRRYLNQHKISALTKEKTALDTLYRDMLEERRKALERNEMLLKEKRHLLTKLQIMLLKKEVKEKDQRIQALLSQLVTSMSADVAAEPMTPPPRRKLQGASVRLSKRITPFEFTALSSYEHCVYLKEAPSAEASVDTEAVVTAPTRVLVRMTSYPRSAPLLVYKFCLALLQRLPEAACASIVGSFASALAFQEALFSDTRMMINLVSAAVVGTVAVIASLFELSGLEIQARDEEREIKHLEQVINEEAKELYRLKAQHTERWSDLTEVTKQEWTTPEELRRLKALTDTIRRRRQTAAFSRSEEQDAVAASDQRGLRRALAFDTLDLDSSASASDNEEAALLSPQGEVATYGTPVKATPS